MLLCRLGDEGMRSAFRKIALTTQRPRCGEWTPKSIRRGVAQGVVDGARGAAEAAGELNHMSLLRAVLGDSGGGRQRWRSLRGLRPYQITRLEDYVSVAAPAPDTDGESSDEEEDET